LVHIRAGVTGRSEAVAVHVLTDATPVEPPIAVTVWRARTTRLADVGQSIGVAVQQGARDALAHVRDPAPVAVVLRGTHTTPPKHGHRVVHGHHQQRAAKRHLEVRPPARAKGGEHKRERRRLARCGVNGEHGSRAGVGHQELAGYWVPVHADRIVEA